MRFDSWLRTWFSEANPALTFDVAPERSEVMIVLVGRNTKGFMVELLGTGDYPYKGQSNA